MADRNHHRHISVAPAGIMLGIGLGGFFDGIALLWRSRNRHAEVRPSGLALVGYMLAGRGWFSLVEGIVSHHILNLHNLVEALAVSVWD